MNSDFSNRRSLSGASSENQRDAINDDLIESFVASAKILIVDDDPLLIEILVAYLEDVGYRNIVTVDDSRAAVDTILSEKPDVVLLDLNMPEVSGFDVLQSMRATPALRHTPVVVLTSSTDAPNKLRALEYGATDFLAKPVDESEFTLRLRNILVVCSPILRPGCTRCRVIQTLWGTLCLTPTGPISVDLVATRSVC